MQSLDGLHKKKNTFPKTPAILLNQDDNAAFSCYLIISF